MPQTLIIATIAAGIAVLVIAIYRQIKIRNYRFNRSINAFLGKVTLRSQSCKRTPPTYRSQNGSKDRLQKRLG